eukprot:188810-Rhodomonas_salina.1
MQPSGQHPRAARWRVARHARVRAGAQHRHAGLAERARCASGRLSGRVCGKRDAGRGSPPRLPRALHGHGRPRARPGREDDEQRGR